MSCYTDIYNDYPLRCAELWERFNSSAKEQDLDVTLMLACAAGGFATPFELLKIQPGQAKNNHNHPAFFNFNEKKYQKCLNEMNKALDDPAFSSLLFRNVKIENCFYGKCIEIEEIRNKVEYKESNIISKNIKSRNIVRILRNSIAHNNIYAFSRNTSNQISELTFFSEIRSSESNKSSGYQIFSMPIEEFSSFLTSWFDLLKKHGTPRNRQILKLVIANAIDSDDDRISAYA